MSCILLRKTEAHLSFMDLLSEFITIENNRETGKLNQGNLVLEKEACNLVACAASEDKNNPIWDRYYLQMRKMGPKLPLQLFLFKTFNDHREAGRLLLSILNVATLLFTSFTCMEVQLLGIISQFLNVSIHCFLNPSFSNFRL